MSAHGSRSLCALVFAALVEVAAAAPPAEPAHAASTGPVTAPDAPPAAVKQVNDFVNAHHVIANGGGSSSGGTFAISGSIGQADVEPLQPSTGGAFAITGGFWFAATAQTDDLFEDGFEGP